MAKNYIGNSSRINIPADTITSAVSSGDLIILAKMVGVVLHDGVANAPNVLKVDGEWRFPKATGAGTGGAIGAPAYKVAGQNQVTGDATGNDKIGVFTAVAGDNDTVALVRLDAVGVA